MPFTYPTLSVILVASLITGMHDMPRAQDATTWSPQLKRKNPASEGPVIWTREERRDGSRPVDVVPEVPQGLIFQEDFNSQPDWTSASESTDRNQFADSHVIPEGWYAVRQDPTFAPSVGDPDKHETIEILASNADKARGGEGKSYVSWRDSHDAGWDRWNSESMMARYIPGGLDQFYFEMYISFGPGWTPAGTSKIFRVSSWSGGGSFYSFGGGGEHGPVFFWNYSASSADTRNRLSFRNGTHGMSPYLMSQSSVVDIPPSGSRELGSGDISMNWTNETIGQIPDKLNGGFLPKTFGTLIEHERVFGPPGTWTKMAFFFKINSAPGSLDGQYKQWIDDVPVIDGKVMWVPESAPMTNWNMIAIGGNDFFREYPNEDRHEEYYAIDDIACYHNIPEHLL